MDCACGTYSCDSDAYDTCIKCHSTCGEFCTDLTSTGCLDINVLCGSKTYSSTLGICLTLISNCIDQASSTICNTCDTGYYLYSDSSGCGPCSSSCSLCTGPLLSDCECAGSNVAFDTNTQECVCDEGFYDLNNGSNGCLGVCDLTCLTCSSSGAAQCTSCTLPKVLAGGACTDPSIVCDSSCLTCSSSGYDQCTSCASPKVLVNGICTDESVVCDASCSSCAGPSSSKCLSCQDPNAYVPNPPGECTCEASYYKDSSTSTCELCSSPCQTCSSIGTNCLSCVENYTLTSNNTCIQCDSGYYSNDGTCEDCHDSCSTCANSSESGCMTCQDSSIEISNPPGSCLCEKSEYAYQNSPLVCKQCPEGCESCDSSECFKCLFGYSLNSSDCLKNELVVLFKVNSNLSVSLVFSKDLEGDLKSEDLLITIGGESMKFKLKKIKQNSYLINLRSVSKTSKKVELNIVFVSKIFGVDYSELKVLAHTIAFPSESNSYSALNELKRYGILGILLLAFIICFASVLSNTQPSLLWLTFNTLQIISYIPLFNIPLTSTLRNFFMSTLPLSILINIWRVFDIISCENSEIPSTYYDYGYTCHNIILTTGEVFFGLLCGILFFIFLLPLSCLLRGKFRKFTLKKLSEYNYSFFFRFWIQSFLDVSVPAGVSLNYVLAI